MPAHSSKKRMRRSNKRKSKTKHSKKQSNSKKITHSNALKVQISVYCMKCRNKVMMHKDGRHIKETKRGTSMLRGKCPKCDGVVVRIF